MWEVLSGLFVGTLISGVVPLVNAEVLVVVAAAAVPDLGIPLVAAVSATGQMMAKTLLFGLARWAPAKLPQGARKRLAGASDALARRGGAAGSLVFTSALVGLPPFYGVSLACGALGMGTPRFVAMGSAGRLVRFGALAWMGHQLGAGAAELVAEGGVLELFSNGAGG